jgi:PAS domain-containing protein
MAHDHDHNDMMAALVSQYAHIFDNSTQGVYIYLNDELKACNKKFAALLGYGSPEEWAKNHEPFLDAFVAESSQETLATAFGEAMEANTGSTNTILWKKQNGETVKTTVILVPIMYEGHIFALHFVSE